MYMIKIKIPASTANIGPGFDCLGIALNIFNTFYIEEIPNGLIIENCPNEFKNFNNLVYSSMIKYFNYLGYSPKGVKISFDSNIPICSGLGSSSTCILAGVIAANILSKSNLSTDEVLTFATNIEGHCDNLTSSLLGGLTVSFFKDKVYHESFLLKNPITFYSLTPNFTLPTEVSRSILPKTIELKDCVFNIGASSMVLASLINNDIETLKSVCEDKIHEKYRTSLIPNFNDIKKIALINNAICAYLSGAGPTIMCIVESSNSTFKDNMTNYLKTLDINWTIRELMVCNEGTTIEYINN